MPWLVFAGSLPTRRLKQGTGWIFVPAEASVFRCRVVFAIRDEWWLPGLNQTAFNETFRIGGCGPDVPSGEVERHHRRRVEAAFPVDDPARWPVALVAMLLPGTDPIKKVAIVPLGQVLGVAEQLAFNDVQPEPAMTSKQPPRRRSEWSATGG